MIKSNVHTHLDNTQNARLCPRKPVSFVSWLIRVTREYTKRTDDQCLASVQQGIAHLLTSGTTHIGDISARWKGVEKIVSSNLKGIVFLEVLGLQQEDALSKLEEAKAVIDALRSRRDHGSVQVGLSLHSPYSCNFELLRQGAAWCRKKGVPLCIHVAESPVETAILLGKTYAGIPTVWLKALHQAFPGRTPPRMSPVLYLDSLGVLNAKPLLVHAVNVSDEEIKTIYDRGCSVVHCPRSNHLLSCGRMPLEKYFEVGIKVYLGTDGLASSPSLDVCGEVRFAKELHSAFVDPKEIDKLVEQPFP